MHYFIGLDNGGTATKAALFDRSGKEIGKAVVATASITPKPGFVERDMEEMWEANCSVISRVLSETGVDTKDVAGIGIAGHGKGLYLWGKDGKPARNGIISTDNRAWVYPKRWAENGTEDKVFARTAQHILACQPVSLLAWLRDNEPESYRNIRWVFECKDYVRFRLTGEARAEITDCSGANLMNLHTRDYDGELLKLFGLEEIAEALPPLCRATEICGHVTEEAAERTENRDHPQDRQPGGRAGPQGDSRQGGNRFYPLYQPTGEQASRRGRQAAQEGNGQEQENDPVDRQQKRGKGRNRKVYQQGQQGQLLEPVQLRKQDAQLRAEHHGRGRPEAAGDFPAERIQRIQVRGQQRDAEHRTEGQLEGDSGQLDR